MTNRQILLMCALALVAVAGYVVHDRQRESGSADLLSQSVSIPAAEQRQGDPLQGKHHLLNSPYVNCGLPLQLVEQVDALDPALRLPGREGAAAAQPYFNNVITDAGGQQLLTSNCLLCHAAPLFDDIVVGLGNEFLDFTEDPSREIERFGALITTPQQEQAWRKLADRVSTVAPYIVASTVGANIANNLTFALMAHRDPETLLWSDEPVIAPPDTEVLPVSVPPWWRMAKKNAMFYQGQLRGDHARFMMTASILCADGPEDIEQTNRYAADIRSYIASLQPPDYPFAINVEQAAQGRQVFLSTCASCHGDTEDPDGYPNLLIPLDVIGTDPALAVQAAVDYRRFEHWVENSYFAQGTEIQALQGYVPPPLDGVWATAPFLHNGSVPTIEALLDSSRRPQFWRHRQPRAYDQQQLGWVYESLDSGKSESQPHRVNKWIYDTRLPGYGNSGHLFGDPLSQKQRSALLEYLKTL